MKRPEISISAILIISATIFTLAYNNIFFEKFLQVYPIAENSFFFINISLVLFFVTLIYLNLFSFNRILLKIWLIFNFIVGAMTFHAINAYNIVVDKMMLVNLFSSNVSEIKDLLTIHFLLWFTLLAIIPIALIGWIKFKKISLLKNTTHYFLTIIISALIIFVNLKVNSKSFASFFRKHKFIRSYINPIFPIYSLYKYKKNISKDEIPFEDIAKNVTQNSNEKNILFLVIGETARGDHFSVNGYSKETTPLMRKEKIITFSDVTSCGTSTAHSVPCIFSPKAREDFSIQQFNSESNLLDIIAKLDNTKVIWRDNNSDSKGVAKRVEFEDFKNNIKNKICDEECRDIGMLEDLEKFIEDPQYKNIVIVFHMMGSHGPSYYKRYPKEFEKFTPVCRTGQLEKCSREEINNVYDNTILYTDYFLSQAIAMLKKYEDNYLTSLFYVSDHGESLGENGYYLHGYPYRFAPKEQTNAAILFWPGHKTKLDLKIPNRFLEINHSISHDNVFHTILGLLKINTYLYNKDLDLIKTYL